MKDLHRSLWPLAAGALALALVVPLAAGARPPGGPERGLESRIEQLELDAETPARAGSAGRSSASCVPRMRGCASSSRRRTPTRRA
jgi:hypothetical protein